MVLGDIIGIQIIGLVFGLAMIYFTYIYYKKKDIGLNSFVVWFLIWSGLVLGTLFPGVVSSLKSPLVVVRVLDLYVVIAVFVILAATFYNFHVLVKTQRDVKKIVRKLALEEN